jgi:deoxyribose-phosphate aldolase
LNKSEFAELLDHTLLKPEASRTQIEKLCQEALEFQFGAVCVPPFWVPVAAKILKGSLQKIVTVIGFPLGNTLTEVKIFETERVLEAGAQEIDMMMNVGALKSGEPDFVLKDIQSVVHCARQKEVVLVKVILETALLNDSEIIAACRIATQAGADFVKTSTGFMGGSTVGDVELMHKAVGSRMGIKAAGGIQDLEIAEDMIRAGANRIGSSQCVAIMKQFLEKYPD